LLTPIKQRLKQYEKQNMKALLILFLLITTSCFSQDTTIVESPKVPAEYQGGAAMMQKFIAENVSYPREAIENNEQGRVYLIFVVEKNGSISNIEVVKGVSEAINKEAIRLVSSMPKWIPGEDDKQVARTNVRLPINFTLSNGMEEEEPKKKKRRRR